MISRNRRRTITLFLAALSLAGPAWAMKPGGWSKVAVTDKGVVAAAAFAVQAKRAAMQRDGDQVQLELEAIEEAEQQVVAGMNYRVKLKVSSGGLPRTAVAVVWVREWLDAAERNQLTSWEFVERAP